MPRALQAKGAREMDSKAVLSKCRTVVNLAPTDIITCLAKILDRWVQAYRTKIALKAVASVYIVSPLKSVAETCNMIVALGTSGFPRLLPML
jgi:hypothetical protein